MSDTELLAITSLIIPKLVEAEKTNTLNLGVRSAALRAEVALREMELLIIGETAFL